MWLDFDWLNEDVFVHKSCIVSYLFGGTCWKCARCKKRERSHRSGGPTMIGFTELCNHGDPLPTGAWLEDLDTLLERWQQNTDDVHSTARGSSAVFFQSTGIASINSKIHWCAAQTFRPVQTFVHSGLFFLSLKTSFFQ